MHLVRDAEEAVAPAVDHDHAAARPERLEVVRVAADVHHEEPS